MSLLGRLEDLSLPDIVQIVFLSRRTGILEIIDSVGRHTVIFHHGLIVNASSPEVPDLATYLESSGVLTQERLAPLRKMEDVGIPLGTALLEMNLMGKDDLAQLVQQRITNVVAPLLDSRDGEFNFILSDSIGQLDIEYEPKSLFKEGGIPPQKILGAADGEKLKPLRGLEESMRAGKALLRGAAPPAHDSPAPTAPEPAPAADAAPPTPELEVPLFDELPDDGAADVFADAAAAPSNVVAFPSHDDDIFGSGAADAGVPAEPPPPVEPPKLPAAPPVSLSDTELVEARVQPPRKPAGPTTKFRVESASGLSATDRNVVLYERSPLLRVAAKRAFTKRGMKIAQYGSIEDTKRAAAELLKNNEYFITFLELSGTSDDSDGDAPQLLSSIKRKNHLLPVVLIDREADLRRRTRLLKLGADHYLTKPSEAHLQPALADEQLALFADELVNFAERSFEQFTQILDGTDDRNIYALAEQERASRTEDVLRILINELSNPNELDQLAETILRLASEYFDRALLLVGKDRFFSGVGGVNAVTEDGGMMERARGLRISYADPSVLADVAASAESHRGKIRRTDANMQLIQAVGSKLPTEVAVLPITNRGQVIGLLYGDNAERLEPFGDLGGLEMFLSQAGFALENAVIASSKRGDRSWDLG